MLEYPKHVYKGEGDERHSIVVKNADEEAAALDKGYEAIASVQPTGVTPAAAALGSAYLEYPKHVYRGEGEDRESVVVKDAEAEAKAAEDGYLALDAVEPAVEDAPAVEAPAKAKRGRKPKAA